MEEIRAKCDLVDIVSAYVALKKSGRSLVGLCPFHNEKTPSFHVNPERQVWKCFGCGEGGDVFSFVQKIEKSTFGEAAEQLARRVGVRIERSEKAVRELSERDRLFFANNTASAFFGETLKASRKAQDYLANRGVGPATIEKYRLGYAPDSWEELYSHLLHKSVTRQEAIRAGLVIPRDGAEGCYDRFRDRLIFPILDNSERTIGFGGRALGEDPAKYLNSPETPLFVKNRTIYGLNFARRAMVDQDRVIVVEGYFDAISAQEAGFENTVATMGTALTEEHVNTIARFTTNVIVAFDADSAGAAAALRSQPIFERAGFSVRILGMPAGEDPDSLLRGGDRSKFARMIEEAMPIPDYRIDLVISRADLETDAGKTEAVKAAAAVIAEVESPIERERLVRFLAKYHPGFGTGTALAEDHLRGEVNRLRYRLRRARPTGSRPTPETVQTDVTEGKPSLIEQSERLLLGILILRGGDASKVFGALPPNEFMDESARALAQAVSGHIEHVGKIDQEMLRTQVVGTPAERLLTDILIELDESKLNHPIEELVNSIAGRKKFERRLRMRALAQKIQEGAIKRGDEEYEEYWGLVKEGPTPWRR